MRRCLSFLAMLGLAALGEIPSNGADLPNIVVIYADDLGYGDAQCYNPDRGKVPTPHIDRLAAAGMRFTDAHSSSGVCSPSRYTLLTGRYHWRTRLQSGIVGTWQPPLIAPDRVTIGTLAKQHGYRTACIGKWHLGWDWPIEPADRPFLAQGAKGQPRPGPAAVTDAHREAWRRIFSQPIGNGPTTRGFDVYFGTDVPNWPPYCFIDNDRTLGIPTTLLPTSDFQHHRVSTQGPALEGWSLEAVLPTLRSRAVGFIEASATRPEPFLLYMPLTSPHTPLAVNAPWKGRPTQSSARSSPHSTRRASPMTRSSSSQATTVSPRTWEQRNSKPGATSRVARSAATSLMPGRGATACPSSSGGPAPFPPEAPATSSSTRPT
jgi:arylsulfatase A